MKDVAPTNKFLTLLIALLAFFVLSPLLTQTKLSQTLFGLLFTVVLAVSVYAIEKQKKILLTALLLGLTVLVGHWATSFYQLGEFIELLDYLVTIAFFTLITVSVLSYVIHDTVITQSTFYGAICGYLLIGLLWSFIHLAIFKWYPQAYSLPSNFVLRPENQLDQFIYYSFVTLSTLGFGDIVPVGDFAKALSWLEAITGQVYLTVWIAQLVGLHISQRGERDRNKQLDER